ncbi:hypothetical protein HBI87_188680 [Parastagonospora nodorum]|nr:hypothetical protein HBI87_188680 [Parastagonospora nodorum]
MACLLHHAALEREAWTEEIDGGGEGGFQTLGKGGEEGKLVAGEIEYGLLTPPASPMEEKEDGFSLARHVSDKDEADNEEKDERKDKEEDEYDVEGENSSLLASIPEESEFARLLREIHMFSCSTGSSTGSEKEKEDNDESEISQASELPEEQNGSSNASEVSLEERDEYELSRDELAAIYTKILVVIAVLTFVHKLWTRLSGMRGDGCKCECGATEV